MALNEETWAIVETMGHQMVCGRVREEQLAGAPMLLVEIEPATEGGAPVVQWIGSGAIYRVTPCTESVARKTMADNAWALPAHVRRLVAPAGDDDVIPWREPLALDSPEVP